MKRVILFLAAGLAMGLAVVVVLFVLAGSRTPEPPLANLPTRMVLPTARPLVRLDERFLLAGVDNKIVNSTHAIPGSWRSSPSRTIKGDGYECFSREGGRFAVTLPEVSGGYTSYANMVYRWIQDWDQPARLTNLKTLEFWNTNPHDCTAVKYGDPTSTQGLRSQRLRAIALLAAGPSQVEHRRQVGRQCLERLQLVDG